MKVYTCVDHQYVWPVGVASVVVANNEEEARQLLIAALKVDGIDQTEPFTLDELDLSNPNAQVLLIGNY